MGQVSVLRRPAGTARSLPAEAAAVADPPLVVDLDGTLVFTDTLAESVFVLARQRPAALFGLLVALLHGRAAFKRAASARARPDLDTLPWNDALVDFLRAERRRGRRLVLATGADDKLAARVAARLGLFDQVWASDGRVNLSARRKAQRCVEAFGVGGFDYAGDSRRDLAVWRVARRAVVGGEGARRLGPVGRLAVVDRVFGGGDAERGDRLRTWLTELRWRHWSKNALVLLPLVLAHRFDEPGPALRSALAALAFCATASSVYLVNDLLDLPSDRRHPRKRERPVASGRLPIVQALAGVPVLWGVALLACRALPAACTGVLLAYVATMLAYSLRLKDLRFVDAAVLGGGYAARLLMGAWAIGAPIDPWMAGGCVPTFFGFALLKRRAELAAAPPGKSSHRRTYESRDARALERAGGAAAILGLVALALVPVVGHAGAPRIAGAWIACALMAVWTLRMWRFAASGRIDDDPVTFALRDRGGLALGLAAVAGFGLFA